MNAVKQIGRARRIVILVFGLCLMTGIGADAMTTEEDSAGTGARSGTEETIDDGAVQNAPAELPSLAVPVTEIFVREEPSPDAAAIGIAHVYDTVTIIEETDSSWVKVLFPRDGEMKEGYLNSVFLGDRIPAHGQESEQDSSGQADTPQTELQSYAAEDELMILPDLSKMRQDDIIWIGDSRTVGMSRTEKNDQYLAEESIGIRWMEEDGRPVLEALLDESGNYPLVFCFGINDITEASRFVSVYRDMLEHHDSRIMLMSVNPVDEYLESQNGYQVHNQEVKAFNQVIEDAFPDEYIDMYEYLMEQGYGSTDGVHYTEETYHSINQHMHELLKSREEQSEEQQAKNSKEKNSRTNIGKIQEEPT